MPKHHLEKYLYFLLQIRLNIYIIDRANLRQDSPFFTEIYSRKKLFQYMVDISEGSCESDEAMCSFFKSRCVPNMCTSV